MDLARRLEVVEEENDRLRERVRQLERMLLPETIMPVEFGLTGHENALLKLLLAREFATKEHILTSLYALRPDDPPEIKIVDVFVCKIRKKLKPFGIEIATRWGVGYQLSAEAKTRVQAMMAGTSEPVLP